MKITILKYNQIGSPKELRVRDNPEDSRARNENYFIHFFIIILIFGV